MAGASVMTICDCAVPTGAEAASVELRADARTVNVPFVLKVCVMVLVCEVLPACDVFTALPSPKFQVQPVVVGMFEVAVNVTAFPLCPAVGNVVAVIVGTGCAGAP